MSSAAASDAASADAASAAAQADPGAAAPPGPGASSSDEEEGGSDDGESSPPLESPIPASALGLWQRIEGQDGLLAAIVKQLDKAKDLARAGAVCRAWPGSPGTPPKVGAARLRSSARSGV